MTVLNILAGDFAKGKYSSYEPNAKGGTLLLERADYEHSFLDGPRGSALSRLMGVEDRRLESVDARNIEALEVASEESVKRFGGTVGWGLAGGLLLGPLGLAAGLLTGGQGKDVTFVCKLKDGRKFLATAPSKTFTALQAASFH